MSRRTAVLVAVVAIILLLTACRRLTTVVGGLVLQPGQTGDVQNCRVELHEQPNLIDASVQVDTSRSGSTDSSGFEFSDVAEGSYYVRAWKDRDLDGSLSSGDMVGVLGGRYVPGQGGTRITVVKGTTTDVGQLMVTVLRTTVVGTLALLPGETGDVQNSRVELHARPDLSGSPVQVDTSRIGTTVSSEFEFADAAGGSYYLLAWKDLNHDGSLSGGDLVGVHGGTYVPGQGGTQITVVKGETTDVGEIEMRVLPAPPRETLRLTMAGERTSNNLQTDFSYSFNHDCAVASAWVTFPGYDPMIDPDLPGAKTAGTTYHSVWNAGGAEMPTGRHVYVVDGTWDGGHFSDTVYIQVN